MSRFDGRLLEQKRGFISQEDLARRAGISVRQLQRLERNKSKPQASTIGALAGALGCGLAELCRPSTTLPRIRVAFTDDHTMVRWALCEVLGKAGDIEIVGEVGTAAETLDMIKRGRPDVLILDISLPDRSGLDLLAEIRLIDAAPLVVMLSWHTEPSIVARAMAAGAHGYVNKAVGPDELLDAIRAVSRGEQVVPSGVKELLGTREEHPGTVLIARELQVMVMLARGLTNRMIAEHLEVSIKTIDTHRAHVLKKLGLRNISELVRFAVKHGYTVL